MDEPLSMILYNVQIGEERTVTRTFKGTYRSPCLANGPELPCEESLTVPVTVKGLPNNGNSTGDERYCGVTYKGVGSAMESMENYAVGMDGSVWRWTRNSDVPRKVEDLSNVIAVESGNWGGWNSKNLALKADGTVWSWGTIPEPAPNESLMVGASKIESLNNVRAVAVGTAWALALKNDGTVWAWGHLGNGETWPEPYLNSEVPLRIQELSGIISIKADHYTFYALDSNKRVWKWGESYVGDISPIVIPTQLSNVTDVISLDFDGGPPVFVKSNGTVWKGISSVQQVNGITGAKSAVAFKGAVIFSKGDGTVWTIGSDPSGAVGHPTLMQVSEPWRLSDLSEVISIEPGCFAISRDGTVRNWGMKHNQTSGSVTQAFESRPSMVLPETSLNDFISVASGGGEGVGVKSNGSVWVWGGTGFGRENGTLEKWREAIQVSTNGLAVARGVARNKTHTLLLKMDKTVAAWGINGYGELGNNNYTQQSTPVPVVGLSGVKAIACGADHSLALTEQGKVWSWGRGNDGQLGDGLTSNRWQAAEVGGLSGVIAIGANAASSFALKANGELWGWGVDVNGDGLKDLLPVRIGNLEGITSFAAGIGFTAALTRDGKVWTWDAYSSGVQNPSTLRQMIGMENVRSIWANSAFTSEGSTLYAVKADGTLWAQGDNVFGQLGNGTVEPSSVPVRVGNDLFVGTDARVFPGFLGGSVLPSPLTTYILKGDKTLIALGASGSGQLANGQSSFSPQREPLNGVHLKAPIPSASIQPLAGGGRIQIGQPVVVTASASVTAGSIAKVEFYADGLLLGEDDEEPYEYSFQSNTWGNIRIHAISVSDQGARSAPSEEAEINVSYDFDGDTLPDWKELANYSYLYVYGADDDSDFDGVPNALEVLHGRDPFSPFPLEDVDGDGLPDDWEYVYFNDLITSGGTQDRDGDGLPDSFEWEIISSDPNDQFTDLVSFTPDGDADGDGLSNIREFQIGSNCLSADTDGDGMTDGFEEAYFSVAAVLDDGTALPHFGPSGDHDADGKTNLAEFLQGGIPILADEQTSLSNQTEPIIAGGKLRWFGVDGMIYRLRYRADLSAWETLPTLIGRSNRWIEIPLSDLRYPVPTAGAFKIDSWVGTDDADGDGLPNMWEYSHGLSLFVNDASADPDGDGLSNLEEYQKGLNPRNRDSDGDGYEDKLSIGLAGYWRLDEENGSVAADRAGGNHGSLIPLHGGVGAAEWGQGILNGALGLQPSAANPRLSLPASTLNATTDATVSLWFKTAEAESPSSVYSRCLVSAVGSGGSQELVIRLERSGGGLQVTATTGNPASPQLSWSIGWPLDDASWHHLALTRTSTALRLYVDSVDLGAKSAALSALSIGEGGLLLGQAQSTAGTISAGSGWEGSIDEIRIYRQAIAPEYSPGLYSPDDSDGDRLSDAWELKWFGNLAQNGAEDSDLDGVINSAEYQAGSSPSDFFDGEIPMIEVSPGNPQEVVRGRVSQLIKFRVTVPSPENPSLRVPVVGVPVSLEALTHALGAVPGRLALSQNGVNASNQKAAITDPLGEVGVYFLSH